MQSPCIQFIRRVPIYPGLLLLSVAAWWDLRELLLHCLAHGHDARLVRDRVARVVWNSALDLSDADSDLDIQFSDWSKK